MPSPLLVAASIARNAGATTSCRRRVHASRAGPEKPVWGAMDNADPTEIFLVAVPGLESALLAEAQQCGFRNPRVVAGGIVVEGGWDEAWRANLRLRGASRVLVRLGAFRALHLAQLDKRARKFPWGDTLRRDVPVRVEATCKASRIYHSGAAAQRVATAIREELGAVISDSADVIIKCRIEADLCTISVDATGQSLHKRGHKAAVGKAPLRETMASLFLAQCGFNGREPVLDPMCGSGTFVIEAAEVACGLAPGRSRHFAFEQLATFDAARWQAMRGTATPAETPFRFFGRDRDAGAVTMAQANATRAGVSTVTDFRRQTVSELERPDGPPGLVILNPPYGDRIGDKGKLHALYGALGKVLLARFSGWRVGLVTNEAALARSTHLPFKPPGPSILHGGLKVRLYQTGALV